MKYRIVIILVLAALMLSMLTACSGNKKSVLSTQEAQKIALEDAGLSAKDVDDIHTHITEYEKTPSYSVHITVGDMEYEYVVDAVTGEILISDEIG